MWYSWIKRAKKQAITLSMLLGVSVTTVLAQSAIPAKAPSDTRVSPYLGTLPPATGTGSLQAKPTSDDKEPVKPMAPDMSALSASPTLAESVMGCGPVGCQPACQIPCAEPKCPPCGPMGDIWAGVEYIGWAVRGGYVPPLVTASPPGTVRANAGVLGTPGATTIIGDDRLNDGIRHGVRAYFGGWMDECHTVGFDRSFFWLPQNNDSSSANGNGAAGSLPIISRPFFNVNTGRQDAQLVSFPNVVSNGVSVNSQSNIWGSNGNILWNLCCDCNSRWDFLLGNRYMRFDEELTIQENLIAVGNFRGVPAGSNIIVSDNFRTENRFYGGQVGLSYWTQEGRWSFDARGVAAIGLMQQVVEIAGNTQVFNNGQTVQRPGGLLAQRTNIGRYDRDQFGFIPEIGARIGYQLTNHIRATAGYNFMWINSVVRPGDQIDYGINPTQIPPGTLAGQARPAFQFKDSDAWIQGYTVGLEFRY